MSKKKSKINEAEFTPEEKESLDAFAKILAESIWEKHLEEIKAKKEHKKGK